MFVFKVLCKFLRSFMNSCPPTVLAGPGSSVYKGKYKANTLSS